MKLKITLAHLLIIFSLASYSQPWMQYVEPRKENNFFAIQKAFQEYAKVAPSFRTEKKFGIEKNKIPGFKHYKRWEYFWESRINPDGSFPEVKDYYNEWLKINNSKSQRSATENENWSLVGPFQEIPANEGGMGRVNCIAFKPNDPQTIWIGTPSGGIWTSNNGGNTWNNTTTDNLPVLGISDIVFNPLNTNTIYIATGDGPAGDTYSLGVLKSTNGGITWQTTGLTYTFSQSRRIYKLFMHPTDTSTLFACTSSGLQRTINAGANWASVKSGVVRDLKFKPDDASVVYCSSNTAVFKSTNSGATFGTAPSGTGMPTSGTGRVSIGVSAAAPDIIYALASKSSDDSFRGIYKSNDAGLTWTTMASTPNLLGWDPDGSDGGGQAFYTLTLAVSPSNANELYVGGVNVYKSTNGGQTFSLNAHWYGGGGQPYVHADIHDIKYIPGTTNSVLNANDGGVFKSSNGGNTYTDLSAGLAIKQIYKFSNATADETSIIMGTQDNGTVMKFDGFYDRVIGGDGMDCIIDYANNNVVFGELYYGDLYKSDNGGNSFYSVAPATDGAWVTPIEMSPFNHNTMFAGYTEIYKSIDNGDNWSAITNNLTNGGTYRDIAASTNQNYIYAATNSRVYVSTDAGVTFTLRNSLLPSSNYTSIETKPGSPQTAYLTVGAFSGSNKVYRTTNAGVNWINYTKTGLPVVPVNCIAFMNNSPERVFVGTDLGVYYTDTTLTEWLPFNNGLPNTIISDLEFHTLSNKLRAATYGRGVWETSMANSFLVSTNSKAEELNFQIFPNPSSGNFRVNFFDDLEKNKIISIMDVTGKVVFEKNSITTKSLEINGNDFSNGIYFVKVSSAEKTSLRKVVVQK